MREQGTGTVGRSSRSRKMSRSKKERTPLKAETSHRTAWSCKVTTGEGADDFLPKVPLASRGRLVNVS